MKNYKRAFATGGILAGAAAQAQAAVIVTDLSTPLNTSTTGQIYFSPELQTADTDELGQFELNFADGGKPTISSIMAANQSVGSGNFAFNLSPGTVVGPSSSFVVEGDLTAVEPQYVPDPAPFTEDGTPGYLGLEFTDVNSVTDYAWAQVSYNTDGSLSLYSFAYDNTGAAIKIPGTAPEPSTVSLMLLAMGSVGALVARRKRMAASQS